MPSTSPGINGGGTSAVAIVRAPLSLPRASAIAANVPSARDEAVERSASCSDSDKAGQNPSSALIRAYQRSEAPPTGRSNTGVGEKLAAAITSSGAERNSAALAMTPIAKIRNAAPFISATLRSPAQGDC